MSITIPCPCGGTMRATEEDENGADVIECPECLARIQARFVRRATTGNEPNNPAGRHPPGPEAGMSHGTHVSTCMELTRDMVSLLADLAAYHKPFGEPWWDEPEYKQLMARKAILVERLRLVGGSNHGD